MSAQNLAIDQFYDLSPLIEPIFVEHFKKIYGYSPTLAELKQHLAYTGIDRLVKYIDASNHSLAEVYSKYELAQAIQIYIRKLY